MSLKITYTGTVDENGAVKLPMGKMFREELKKFAGQDIKITVQKNRKSRSVNQNAYYWAVIIPVLRWAVWEKWREFWSAEKAHEFLKVNLLYTELVNEETGEILRKPLSTTANDTFEQEEYHERARNLIFEYFEEIVPLPNEKIELDFAGGIDMIEGIQGKLKQKEKELD